MKSLSYLMIAKKDLTVKQWIDLEDYYNSGTILCYEACNPALNLIFFEF